MGVTISTNPAALEVRGTAAPESPPVEKKKATTRTVSQSADTSSTVAVSGMPGGQTIYGRPPAA